MLGFVPEAFRVVGGLTAEPGGGLCARRPYAELLRQKSATCSCCGRSEHPLTALAYTGSGDRVTWVLCSDCVEVCDRLANRLGQVECPFDVCKEDLKHTREQAGIRGDGAGQTTTRI